jgi:hypothetical protein
MLPNDHRVAIDLSFEHLRGEALTKRYWLTTSSGLVAAEHKAQHIFHSLIGQRTEKGLEIAAYTSKTVLDEEKSLHDIPQSTVRFACDMGIYFGAYLRVDGDAKLDSARVRAFAGTDHLSAGSYTQLAYLVSSDGPGTKKNISFDYYSGPKDHRRVRESFGEGPQRDDYLEVANYELKGQSCACYSWPIIGSIVNGVSKLVLISVSFFGSKFGNMGIAIMLLVFCLRLVLFPVNRYSQNAIQKQAEAMNRLKPKLDAIKEKYKDEPQKFAQEQMKLMKAEGVGFVPVKGCLPMLFQMPIFFGLLSAITFDIDLRHASFLWCIDLSQPGAVLYAGHQSDDLGIERFPDSDDARLVLRHEDEHGQVVGSADGTTAEDDDVYARRLRPFDVRQCRRSLALLVDELSARHHRKARHEEVFPAEADDAADEGDRDQVRFRRRGVRAFERACTSAISETNIA